MAAVNQTRGVSAAPPVVLGIPYTQIETGLAQVSVSWNDTHECNVTPPLKNRTFTDAICIDSMAAANRYDSNASPCDEYRVSC